MLEIENSGAVTRIFGRWPTFHDAEVVSLHFDRAGDGGYHGPTLDVKIHVFEMTNKVDERGYYVLKNHTDVTLRFLDVDNFLAQDFNHQNVLQSLEIKDISNRQMEPVKFEVEFSTSFGLEMSFVCRAVSVVASEPHIPVDISRPKMSGPIRGPYVP